MNLIISIVCNWKKRTLNSPSRRVKVPPGSVVVSYEVSLDDFVTPGKVGFEALHEKLAILAAIHKFELKGFVEQLATTSLFRIAHCLRDHGIPRFVAQEVFKMLVSGHACVWEGAAIKKTVSYVMFLRNIVQLEGTMRSVYSGQGKKSQYILPDNVDEMSIEMLGEELRVAEDIGAKDNVLAKLRRKFHAKQKEEREERASIPAQKGKPARKLTEFEQVQAIIKEDKDEAEYSDVPSTQKKRRKK